MRILKTYHLAARRGMGCHYCEELIPRDNHAVQYNVQDRAGQVFKQYAHIGCHRRKYEGRHHP